MRRVHRVHVVAAIIRRAGCVLIARRRAKAERGGQWEFPGGKVESGEEERQALLREIREELGCEAVVGELLCRHRHSYPDLKVELAFYACTLVEDALPRCLGADALEWADEGRLKSYDFCEADRAVLSKLDTSMR